MKTKTRYIILISEDLQGAAFLLELIKGITRSIKTDIANNFKELTELIAKKLPDLIVMHFKDSSEAYSGFMMKFRQNARMDRIPVLIFSALPDKEEFHDLLRQFSKT